MSTPLKILLTGIFLLLQIYPYAQEKAEFYIKSSIPDSLLKDADAVCRLDEKDVEVINLGKIIESEKHIYTILNSNEEDLANYRTDYDKLTAINEVTGTLYNAQGNEIRHFRKKDMSDLPQQNEAFVSDERMKTAGFSENTFPYTVAFEEEDVVTGTFMLPRWLPPRSIKMSVQVSRYVLTVPSDYKFNTKMINTDIKPVVTQKKDKIVYTWEIRNLPVMPYEAYGISSSFYNPMMLVAPADFEIEGYKGTLSSWKDYGKFYYALAKGRDVLPDDLKRQVHLLTDKLTDPYKKIAVLYDYLQNNTHYVLVMFGIGGWQPFDASYVAKNKYGDCKALSNFMVALLKEAGIKGYPVVINAGENEREFIADFPSHQSNHVICAVPVDKDTVWLECTSQSLPPGYLSGFTDNRYGLLFNEEGGFLVHTPAYLIKDNTTRIRIKAVLDTEGNLLVKSQTGYRGLESDEIEKIVHDISKEDQLTYLKKAFDLPTYTVNSFNYVVDNSNRIPNIDESLDISVTNYASVSGKRIFIRPNILNRSEIKFSDEKERRLDFEFPNEYSESDSLEMLIPPGYTTESKPKDVDLTTRFGKFEEKSEVKSDKIIYYRRFDHYAGRFPASSKDEVKGFYDTIYEADHAYIVLVKKSD
jgi:hypothetical protein